MTTDSDNKVSEVAVEASNNLFNKLNDKQMSEEEVTELNRLSIDMPMGYDQLKRYLPHRYPFMLVDRVTHCSPKTWIKGYKNVSINEPFFTGHFPNNPIFPGVLVVEALAQLSGILAFISEGLTAEDGYLFMFAGMDKVRFKSPVVPGDCLILNSELIVNKRDVYKFKCTAYIEDRLAASAQITIVRQQLETV